MRALYFAVFLLAGCKHFSELQVQQHQEAASAATTETHEVKESGPEHIVMTVEEYSQLCDPKEAQNGVPVGNGSRGAGGGGGNVSPLLGGNAPPALIRRTVTVTDRGPSLDDLRSLSTLQSKVNTALDVKEEKKSGPAGLLGLLGSLWPVVLIGGAILAGFVVWRAKPNWLSFLFKLLGRSQ